MGKHVGLPKVDRKKRYKQNIRKRKRSNRHRSQKYKKNEPHLVLMNATRVKKVKKYFKSISPHLFEKMVEQTNYHLYNYTDNEKPVFLVPRHIHNLVSKMKKMVEIQHCAISIGFFKATRTRAGFDERFYLSY